MAMGFDMHSESAPGLPLLLRLLIWAATYLALNAAAIAFLAPQAGYVSHGFFASATIIAILAGARMAVKPQARSGCDGFYC